MNAKLKEPPSWISNPWYMAGTEHTGEYKVLAYSSFGRIGYRPLSDGRIRIRVEPAPGKESKLLTSLSRRLSWKTPGENGQNRFSNVVRADARGRLTFNVAYGLIKRGRPLHYNPQMPDHKKDFGG